MTYYEMLGKQIVRARVRPHQKITAGRYASRLRLKNLMARWHANYSANGANRWRDAAWPDMHGVNLYIRLNTPWADPPAFLLPPVQGAYPLPTICADHSDPYHYHYHLTWNPADYPGFDWMTAWFYQGAQWQAIQTMFRKISYGYGDTMSIITGAPLYLGLNYPNTGDVRRRGFWPCERQFGGPIAAASIPLCP